MLLLNYNIIPAWNNGLYTAEKYLLYLYLYTLLYAEQKQLEMLSPYVKVFYSQMDIDTIQYQKNIPQENYHKSNDTKLLGTIDTE